MTDTITPAWREDSPSKYRKYGPIATVGLLVGSEMLGKRTGLPYVRPSYLIGTSAQACSTLLLSMGRGLAYAADLGRLMRKVVDLLRSILGPMWREILEASGDIMGSVGAAPGICGAAFKTGVHEGLKYAYNRSLSLWVVSTFIVGNTTFAVLGLEVLGHYLRIYKLRPSYWIIHMVADPLYHTCLCLYGGCLYVADSAMNIVERCRAFVQWCMPWLVPLTRRFLMAGDAIIASVKDTIVSPIKGVSDAILAYSDMGIVAPLLAGGLLLGSWIYASSFVGTKIE